MAGSSGVKQFDLASSQPDDDPLPGPDESRDGRMDPGREQQQGRMAGRETGRTAVR
ncbi:hypothetical protein [Streptomyces sp. SID161]|uniref:hypothetical protein n=1 Tax=Streptomyces sp. SID161 TaxID=2690251 RepID=UPI0019255A65|nr:hypothetical protein [Streptomyces sp. SID161]